MDLTVISACARVRPPNGLELDTPGIDSYSNIPGTEKQKQQIYSSLDQMIKFKD